jgi:hypothetical protein
MTSTGSGSCWAPPTVRDCSRRATFSLARAPSAGQQNRHVGHSYALPVIKLLFATARTCAYPDCTIPLVFVDADRDVREIAVQIAHIRSPKTDGPRHDPDFPRGKLNSDENLLLLCGVHHHPVDRNGSRYATEELLAWKKAQTAEGGGFAVQDDEIRDLVARLESMLDELVQASRLQLQARITGGRLISPNPPRVIGLPLEMLNDPRHEAAAPFVPGRLIGVEVENHGPVGAEVRTAGIDVDYGPSQREPWQYIHLHPQQLHGLAVSLPGRRALHPSLVRQRVPDPQVGKQALHRLRRRPPAIPGLGSGRERRPAARRLDPARRPADLGAGHR